MKIVQVAVPSGIGDVSWIYSKLHNAPEEYSFEFHVVDGWPHRTVNFCQLLPRVTLAKYDGITYPEIVYFQQLHKLNTWEQIAGCGFGRVMLSANLHLERGLRLEDWLPDLTTDFHYPIQTRQDHADVAERMIGEARKRGDILIGVSAASYRGSEAWDTWRSDRWNRFLDMIQELAQGEACFILMGGFWDDLTLTLSSRKDVYEVVGKTSVGEAVELLRRLNGYIGFSSGLGVIGTLLHKPVVMLWPAHQVELSTSWAPPKMLSQHKYVALQWNEPFEVIGAVESWLREHVFHKGDS